MLGAAWLDDLVGVPLSVASLSADASAALSGTLKGFEIVSWLNRL
jgi:hypothetical protein